MSRKKIDRRSDRDRIADNRRTSPCKTTFLNLERTSRASASGASTVVTLPDRKPRKFLPSQQQIMALLSRAVVPEERSEFERRFQDVATTGEEERPDDACIGKTPLNWISRAYQCDYPFQLTHMNEMFRESGTVSEYLDEFYLMDVILNRCPYGQDGNEVGDNDGAPPPSLNREGEAEDCVRLVRSYKPEDKADKNDHKFRAMILFLPQCGVFYCARERRDECVGVPKSLVPLDMSWLRLEREEGPAGRSVSYTFGEGGYVKRFHQQHVCSVSAWRISRRRTSYFRKKRVMYRVKQCSDSDGPMLAPDVFLGEDCASWPHDYLAAEYNKRLAGANSARKDGRHYAPSCHHFRIPERCWIIDPKMMNNVDLMVDVAKMGQFKDRQSVVMIRNAFFGDGDEGVLNDITLHNEVLRRRSSKGSARAKGGDVGTMHAIGTLVDLDRVGTLPYAANGYVSEGLLRRMVVSLSRIGRHCFPQVYAVIRDLESDSGLLPVPPMDGAAGCRAGYTVDMSVNLGNSSHFDVHDASQGYSVWTEEIRGLGANWYFVMPNLHGMRPDGRPFAGVAIRLSHGVAISWDGRVIRHCTSLSMPDGIDGKRVGDGRNCFKNHLYGTFTAAKERVVQAGRLQCAAAAASKPPCPPPASMGSDDSSNSSDGIPTTKRRRRRRRKKKRRRGGGAVADFSDVGAVGCAEGGDVAASGDAGAAAVCPVLEGEVDGGGMVCVEDLEVGGKYRIPKKKRGWSTY